jgi:hypothetical protein
MSKPADSYGHYTKIEKVGEGKDNALVVSRTRHEALGADQRVTRDVWSSIQRQGHSHRIHCRHEEDSARVGRRGSAIDCHSRNQSPQGTSRRPHREVSLQNPSMVSIYNINAQTRVAVVLTFQRPLKRDLSLDFWTHSTTTRSSISYLSS